MVMLMVVSAAVAAPPWGGKVAVAKPLGGKACACSRDLVWVGVT